MKSGIKTTEFWLSKVAVLAAFLVSSGILTDGSTGLRVAAAISGALAVFGYTASRTLAKIADSKVEVAKALASAPLKDA